MKKLVLSLLVIGFTCQSVFAVQQIFYNNAGTPLYGSNNYRFRPPVPPVYGRPYARYPKRYARPVTSFARPARPVRRPPYYHYGYQNPWDYMYPYNSYYVNTSAKITEKEPLSRFDKNYVIPNSMQKKVSCGGITYYSSVNPCQ